MISKKTLVLGASIKDEKYSNKAVRNLLLKGHEVNALGNMAGNIGNVTVATIPEPIDGIDTVTIYLNESNQTKYYDYILSLKPKRIIFNPGAENPELMKIANENGIQTTNACTLVMLSTGQY